MTQPPEPAPSPRRRRRLALAFAAVVAPPVLLLGWLETGPVPLPPPGIQEVTELIEMDVAKVVSPEDADDVVALLQTTNGPVSIGGGRYSMGGQVGTDDALFIDTRSMNDVLALDVDNRWVRVEAGITWRKLIEHIDPHGLSIKVMQSYANFTVGGTLSVNAHGRYMGLGPVVHSVRSIDLVMANGRRVHASRDENPDLFHAAIGGYGALGVIVEAELDLAVNEPLIRRVERLPAEQFLAHFDTVRADPDVVMYNADLYPPDYRDLVAIHFDRTDQPVTVTERLQQGGTSSPSERLLYWWVSEAPLGKQARKEVLDRLRLKSEPVVWRNHEASYDVRGLDPGSRDQQTYVLQEYFIPVDRFEDFLPEMRRVFQAHKVNVVNVSIRHAIADPDTWLSWAPTECFAFVIYYKMGTDDGAWDHAQTWTRAMADAILDADGRWYLPYQIHATPEQFQAAYPRHEAFFALKREVDPTYRFRNRLWDTYLPPTEAYGADLDAHLAEVRATLDQRPSWARAHDQTFLTLPEWLVVYSADEAGAFLADHRPSEFPWFRAIGQFWTQYRAVWAVCRDRYAFNTGYHAMIAVVGASYTVEYGAKGLYESTVGRVFEWLGPATGEEALYAATTADYGAFTHHTPWYAFPFDAARAQLTEVPAEGPLLRRWERKAVQTVEWTAKQAWAGVIRWATGTAYDPQATVIEAWVRPRGAALETIDGVDVLSDLGQGDWLVSIPRYEPFTAAMLDLADRGVEVVEVAGCDTIVVQIRAPAGSDLSAFGPTLVRWPILTESSVERIALEVPTVDLAHALPRLNSGEFTVEHLYDF